MKFAPLVAILLLAAGSFGQTPTIRTVAGNGQYGSLHEGAGALEAPINFPNALAFDNAGNLYIATGFGPVYQMTSGGVL